MINYLVKLGYSRSFLKSENRRSIPSLAVISLLSPNHKSRKAYDRTPFVITFNPALCNPLLCCTKKAYHSSLPNPLPTNFSLVREVQAFVTFWFIL